MCATSMVAKIGRTLDSIYGRWQYQAKRPCHDLYTMAESESMVNDTTHYFYEHLQPIC